MSACNTTSSLELTQFQAWLQSWSQSLELYDERYSIDGLFVWKENSLELYHNILKHLDDGFDQSERNLKRQQMESLMKQENITRLDDLSSSHKTQLSAIDEKKLERIQLPSLVSLRDQPLTNFNPHPRSSSTGEGGEDSNTTYSQKSQSIDEEATDQDPFIIFDDFVDPQQENHSSTASKSESDRNAVVSSSSLSSFNPKSFLHLLESKMFHTSRGYIYEEYEMKNNYPCIYLKPNSEWSVFPYLKNVIRSYTQLPYKIITRAVNFQQVLSDDGIQLPLFYGSKENLQYEIHTCHDSENCALNYISAIIWKSNFLHVLLNVCNLFNGITYRVFPWRTFSHCDDSLAFDISLPYINTFVNIAHTHYYSKTFSEVYNIQYRVKVDNQVAPVFQTCGVVSSRVIGACVTSLSDEKGLRVPSSLNKYQIVIIPILSKLVDTQQLYEKISEIESRFSNFGFRVYSDLRYGTKNVEKFYYWESRGVTLICSVGKSEIENNSVTVKGRISNEKTSLSSESFSRDDIIQLLKKEDMSLQHQIQQRVKIIECSTMNDLIDVFKNGVMKTRECSTDSKQRKKEQMEFHVKTMTLCPFYIIFAPIHFDPTNHARVRQFHHANEKFFKDCCAEFRGFIPFGEEGSSFSSSAVNWHLHDRMPRYQHDSENGSVTKRCIISGEEANAWMLVARY
ncbi:hypothetical protein C9374_012015 [Naegleria lovaniensis]|uniref:Anticodon-binding domain-containing protein n=1 Tax=Naegleria lovaniensis TaxID=51637 RepID=A0AA88KI57_NAELO|nr:uncharacterized protein C9374_012015 [Naegleria lovaniensis]KAG2373552.1 hypothetical protein C9374_012015 [Naegleria lovaniensis]